ncbi:uncharacterized protein LOC119388841 isoform X2 [Rhipicephalus sanguineus]|nr:uncharacterized protein LOC119388841 isoform X2 [Rhipicephalus sanguineus]
MLNVLKPTSKVLVDCAGDVIISYKANASLLRRVVQVVCEYHDECHGSVAHIQEPAFNIAGGTDGLWLVKRMLNCFCNNQELEFENDDVTNAVMHWIYEVLRADA